MSLLNRVRLGVQGTWPQWYNPGHAGFETQQVTLRDTPNGLRYRSEGEDVAEYSSVRCYPILSPLPVRMSELFRAPGSIERMLQQVAADLVSISSNRALVLQLERTASRERFHLPGLVTRADIESLMGKLDLTGVTMTVQQTHLAFFIVANLVRNMTQPRLYRFHSLEAKDGGLDEDGLVMLVHESLMRFARETVQMGVGRSEWKAPSEQFLALLLDQQSGSNSATLYNTRSAGSYLLCIERPPPLGGTGPGGICTLALEFTGRDKHSAWSLRDERRQLLWYTPWTNSNPLDALHFGNIPSRLKLKPHIQSGEV